MRKLGFLITGLLISLALACGGGSHTTAPLDPASASADRNRGLTYTDPKGLGWRLVKDDSSSATRVVLNLVGPAGLKTRGVGFNLKLPAITPVRFGKFETGDRVTTGLPIRDTGAYFLLNSDPANDGSVPPGQDPLEPKLLAGAVKKGNLLTVGIFQKDRREPAKDSGRPLCQIALELDRDSDFHMANMNTISLTITKAKYMAEDVGAFSIQPTYEMAAKAKLVDMTVEVGSLRCN